MLDKEREILQNHSLQAWLDNNRIGTLHLHTGLGKTFIFFRACGYLPAGSKILFLAETTIREETLMKDYSKFIEIYKTPVLKDKEFLFMCYQNAYKLKNTHWNLVGADEIDFSITDEYHKFYENNNYDCFLGLSATINDQDTFNYKGDEIKKIDYINSKFPIVFKHNIDDGLRKGTSRNLTIYRVSHQLDDKTLNVPGGTKKNPFMTTETKNYAYIDKLFKSALFEHNPDKKQFRINFASKKRSTFLYTLRSKIEPVKQLLLEMKGKTVIFGNDLNILREITPNVVSSHEKDNEKILEDFNSDKIQNIASFKMLIRGANLERADNIIIVSFYSKDVIFQQIIGRLRKSSVRGHVFVLVTEGTVEQKWFDDATEGLESYQILYCKDLTTAINVYRKSNTSNSA